MTIDTLLTLDRAGLLDAVRQGHEIAPEDLADTEYMGVSLGMPGWVDRIAWKTFMKTFHADPDTGVLRGWNVRLEQDGIDAAPRMKRKRDAPITFGHYRVRPMTEDEHFRGVCRGLMLDYGAGGNSALDPVGFVRDPLVALSPGDPSLLLGWSYVRIGATCLSTPSFFALRRVGPLSHRIGVPSGR